MTMPYCRSALTRRRQQRQDDDAYDEDDIFRHVSPPPPPRLLLAWKSIIKRKISRTTLPFAAAETKDKHQLQSSTSSSSSLLPLACLTATTNRMDATASLHVYLPNHLWDYLMDALPCSFCGKPCVQGLVMRYRIIQRLDETLLPVHYRLCRAHWSNESDRLLSLFSSVAHPLSS
ncbi:unnamed protein product [Absidia cylindrospora]